MSLEVIEVDGLATIQDASRSGWRKFGVPASGAMDAFALRAANLLAGNAAETAAVEVGGGGITLRARQDCVVAVTGAGFDLSLYIWDFPLWSSYYLRSGWTLRLKKAGFGMWAYLAVSGGIQIPPILGSAATYLPGAFGGFEGRRLQAGDVLRAGAPARPLNDLAARSLPVSARPPYSEHPILDVVMGPQEACFTAESRAAFLSCEYTVRPVSDRMGYRLEGVALKYRAQFELLSEGLTMGAIQVPADGQPIVMMADAPTSGGYPKIGTVISADLPLLAQCMPGKSRLRFRKTTVGRAQMKYRQLMRGLEKIEEGAGQEYQW